MLQQKLRFRDQTRVPQSNQHTNGPPTVRKTKARVKILDILLAINPHQPLEPLLLQAPFLGHVLGGTARH